MSFLFAYPAGGGYTSTLTWPDPLGEGLNLEEYDGLISDVMADQKTAREFDISAPFNEYAYSWDLLSDTDRANWLTFRATVKAGGGRFDIRDATMGAYITVRFPPDGVKRQWRRSGSIYWAVSMRFRDAVAP